MSDFSAHIAAYATANGQEIAATQPVAVTIVANGITQLPVGAYALRSIRAIDLDSTTDMDLCGTQGGMVHFDNASLAPVTFDFDQPIFTGQVNITTRGMLAGEKFVLSFVRLILTHKKSE